MKTMRTRSNLSLDEDDNRSLPSDTSVAILGVCQLVV